MNLLFIVFAFAGLLEVSITGLSTVWFWPFILIAISLIGVSFWKMFESMSLSLIALSWAIIFVYFLSLSQNQIFSHSIIVISSVALYGLARSFLVKNLIYGVSLSFLIFLGTIFSLLRIQYLDNLSLFKIVPLVFLSTYFLFFISEKLMLPSAELPIKIRLSVFSFGVAFFISELYIIFSSFPFTFFAIDFMLFIAYYTLWDMTMRYFSRSFTKRSLFGNIIWFIISVVLILFSIFLFY